VPVEELKTARYLKVRVTLTALRNLQLPEYPGSVFRGALGHALKRAACTQPGAPCPSCLLYQSCSYPYLFNTPAPSDHYRGNRVPPPYVIEPHLHEGSLVEADDSFGFDLTLIGRAVEHLPYLIVAMDLWRDSGLGPAKVPVTLREVTQLGYSGETVGVLFDEERRAHQPRGVLTVAGLMERSAIRNDMELRRLLLRFEVMTRLKSQGRLVDEPDFGIVVRSLLRRAGTLLEVHCGLKPSWDFAKLAADALNVKLVDNGTRWYDWKRYSRRQRSRMTLGGIWGDAVYEGFLTPYWELLVLGTVFHVGKNATFGLGKMSLQPLPNGPKRDRPRSL